MLLQVVLKILQHCVETYCITLVPRQHRMTTKNVFSKIVFLPSFVPDVHIHSTRKSTTIFMDPQRDPTLYKLSPSIMACRSHIILISNLMQWRRCWSYNHLRLKIMRKNIFKEFEQFLKIFYVLLNVFTLMGHIYLWSRGFLRSNIPSDYSIARGRILNDGRGLLCLTKPTLVTITRCWGWWRGFCNALNIYLSCSCWCECSLTRFSIPTRGFTTEPSMKETTTMLELIVFSRSLRASVVRASEWAL